MIRDGILAEQILIFGVKVVPVIWFESFKFIWNYAKFVEKKTISLNFIFSIYHFQYYDQTIGMILKK